MTTITPTTIYANHRNAGIPSRRADEADDPGLIANLPGVAASGKLPVADEGGDTGTPPVSMSKLLSRLVDLLQKLQAKIDEGEGTDKKEKADPLAKLVDQIDTDHDGKVTREEFVAARPEDVSKDEADAFFAELDQDGKGSISVKDLIAALQKQLEHSDDSQSADPLAVLGFDPDGTEDTGELPELKPMPMPKQPDEDVSSLLALLSQVGQGPIPSDAT